MIQSIYVILTFIVSAFSNPIISANSELLHFSGRWLTSMDGTSAYADWPSSTVSLTYFGTHLYMILADPLVHSCSSFFLDVYIDCIHDSTIKITKKSDKIITIANNTTNTDHSVRIVKRTESSISHTCGIWSLSGFSVIGSFMSPNHHKCRTLTNRNILFIGDSLTAGYGVDGQEPCHDLEALENSDHSYATLVSWYFGANFHIIAWSGRGLVKNARDENSESDPDTTMPFLFNRTIAYYSTQAKPAGQVNTYNMSRFMPDVICINLGSNDYSSDPIPTSTTFNSHYVTFIQHLLTLYPRSTLFVMCGPHRSADKEPFCTNIMTIVSTFNSTTSQVNYVNMKGILAEKSDWGCGSHPSMKGSIKMEKVLEDAIELNVNWSTTTST